ncbi:glycosyltransferase [Salmonella enterica]|nr:glycosyltransferase [Salmonella enterica]EIG1434219.1 glycosyltransferase [Salmonella enterica]EIG1439174.1 glycosyltransferase [Salmonella enterica]
MTETLVVTRTRNRNDFLPRAINSVLNQTVSDWHHVIVNDGGDNFQIEETLAPFIERYAGRITVINNSVSKGMEAASNIGISSVNSKYIAIHDDDDSWNPKFLEEMIIFIKRFQVEGVVCHVTQIFEVKEDSEITELWARYYNPDLFVCNLNVFKLRNQFLPISFLFTREAYIDLEGFDEDFKVCGDWDFHYRFITKFSIKVLRKRLANYHTRIKNESVKDKEWLNSSHDQITHNLYKTHFQDKFSLKSESLYLTKIYDFYLKILRCFLRRVME